jgi:glutamine synthetase
MAGFRFGIAHRGASIRIPGRPPLDMAVSKSAAPGANADPYRVAACLVETVCLAEADVTRLPEAAVAAD